MNESQQRELAALKRRQEALAEQVAALASEIKRLESSATQPTSPSVITPPPDGPVVDRYNLPRLPVDRSVGGAAARFKLALLAPASLL